ncbi:hypothetical protein FOZ63_019222, partial [Perkinsus olseni]
KAAARAAEKARREAAAEARRKRKEAAMRAAAAKRAAEARKGDEPATDEASENKTGDDVVMNAQEEVVVWGMWYDEVARKYFGDAALRFDFWGNLWTVAEDPFYFHFFCEARAMYLLQKVFFRKEKIFVIV